MSPPTAYAEEGMVTEITRAKDENITVHLPATPKGSEKSWITDFYNERFEPFDGEETEEFPAVYYHVLHFTFTGDEHTVNGVTYRGSVSFSIPYRVADMSD